MPVPLPLGVDGFEDFVRPHLPVLTAVAQRLVGRDDAQDVVQDALVRAWRRWSTFDPDKGTTRTWLLAIVMDRARAHRIRRIRIRYRLFAEVPEFPVPNRDHAQRVAIERTVADLPRRQREVVVLYYLADLSVEETAGVLGIRVGTVKAHLGAARTSLRDRMEHP